MLKVREQCKSYPAEVITLEGIFTKDVDFWEGKMPCWKMHYCSEEIKARCPAFSYRALPCWEIEGTFCKTFDYEQGGDGAATCKRCPVYQKWGQDKSIETKLFVRDWREWERKNGNEC